MITKGEIPGQTGALLYYKVKIVTLHLVSIPDPTLSRGIRVRDESGWGLGTRLHYHSGFHSRFRSGFYTLPLDFRLVVQKLRREFTHAQDFLFNIPAQSANSRCNFWTTNLKLSVMFQVLAIASCIQVYWPNDDLWIEHRFLFAYQSCKSGLIK